MKRKKLILVFVLAILFSYNALSQGVAINNDGSNADGSAMLDVKSTNAGILVPRLTLSQRNSISSPATGLMIFQTDNTPGFYYNAGTPASPSWIRLSVPTDNFNDADADPSNEIQTLSISGHTVSLSDGGGSVTVPDNVNDADHNPTNEIQALSISGHTVSLSDGGGSVTVPDNNTTYSAGNQLSLSGTTFNVTEGSGSGLDADLLDGHEWSEITANEKYLPDDPATSNVDMNYFELQRVRALQGIDWDDNTGGTNNKYRLLWRDGAHQFYNGGVVVGNYANGTWTDLNDGRLIVEERAGFGTTSPLLRLDVRGSQLLGNAFNPDGDNDNNILNILSGSNSNGGTNGIKFYEDATGFGMSFGYNGTGSGNTNKLAFYNNSNTEIVAIQNGGNVGIGTGSPAERLHINGSVRGNQNGAVRISTGHGYVDIGPKDPYLSHFATDRLGFYFNESITVDGGEIGSYDENLLLQTSGNTRIMVLKDNGNVGISTMIPSEKLDINGKIRMREGATANYVITGDADGVMSWTDPANVVSNDDWSRTGNAGTVSGTNFIGTTDNQDLDFRTNNQLKVRITTKGQLEIFNTGNSVFIGDRAGENDDLSDNCNIFIGYMSGSGNVSGTKNVGIGYMALDSGSPLSHQNTAIGYKALFLNSRGNNTAIGTEALGLNTLGESNAATGYRTLHCNKTGSYNTASGNIALFENTNGSYNTAHGAQSLMNNKTGVENTAIGARSLKNNRTGEGNVAIGYTAYSNSTYSYSYSISIGQRTSITANRQARIGNASSNGATSIGGPVAWTNLSDGRFKDNVQENVAGLNFVMKLRPVTYNLNQEKLNDYLNVPDSLRDRASSAKDLQIVHTGFIAQEVEEAAKECNFDFHGVDAPKNEKDYYGLRYAEFVVPLVKATQEQQGIIKKQEEKIENLEQENAQIRKELNLLKEKINRLEIEK